MRMRVNHFQLRHQKTCSCFWQSESTFKIYVQNLLKIGQEMGALSWTQAYIWAKSEVNWRACAFTTSGVIGHRT